MNAIVLHLAARTAPWAAAALLAACALQPTASISGATPVASDGAPQATPLQAWAQARREDAERAAAAGHWPEALWAWDQVLALEPRNSAALDARGLVRMAQAQAVAKQMRVARAARGDAAVAAYLQVLVHDPGHTAAADALRAIERQRSRSGNVHGTRLASGAQSAAVAGATKATAASPVAALEDREHAALLAHQGDFDAAIALLAPRATEPGVSGQLADLHYRRAERLAATNPTVARAAVAEAVRLDPRHSRARALAKRLGSAAPTAASAPLSSIPRDMRR